MTGKQIAALLTMGAAGVNMGTRFLFTEECSWGPERKQVLVKAELNSTVRSVAFDEVARNIGWPDRCDGRAIANDIVKDEQEGLDLEERVERYTKSSKAGEESRLIVWAGVGVGLANTIQKASVCAINSATVESCSDFQGCCRRVACRDLADARVCPSLACTELK